MDKIEKSKKAKDFLSIFDRVGIATRDRFDHLEINHPDQILEGFESVIVYAEASQSDGMGGFNDYFASLTAQSDLVDYLNDLGYEAVIMETSDKRVSLVTMGIQAGLGEISPVDSLVIKGLGLTASLGAILTKAPLQADDIVSGVCIHCNRCLKVCPIRDKANAKGDLSKCACGKCKNTCPV